MKWSDVEITDQKNTVHKGGAAARFVKTHCPEAPIGPIPSVPTSICVYPGTEHQSVAPKDIRNILFEYLKGKAKSLRILTGDQTDRIDFPVARAVPNVINVYQAKLKVEFIYQRGAEDSAPRIYLDEKSIVSVTAWREGSRAALILPATKGIANFGTVPPGKYKITPNYSELDACKYDWTDETRDVVLNPGDTQIVEFMVEPLYQKVQFIAHCLLTIPNFTFVLGAGDSDKVDVIETDGKREFKFKPKPVDLGRFTKGELDPPLPAGATIAYTDEENGVGRLTLGKRIFYWGLEELDFATPNLEKIIIGEQTSPTSYKFTFKEGFTHENLDKGKLKTEQYELQLGQQPNEKNAIFYLQLLEKKNYWTLGDLNESEKQAVFYDKIKTQVPLPNSSNKFEVTFNEAVNVPLPPPIRRNAPVPKATIQPHILDKLKAILTLNEKSTNWQLSDLTRTLDPVKITVGEPNPTAPGVYPVTFKKKGENYSEKDLLGQWKAKYHGAVNDLDDLKKRIAFVKDTLEKAYAKSNQDPVVLKIFMIPECFFQGLYGAYLTDDAGILLDELQQLVKDKKWKDWVFSFGTVNRVFQGLQPVGASDGVSNSGSAPEIYEMANHAIVIRGGLGDAQYSGNSSTRLIQKLVNSAELADAADLIKDSQVEELRLRKDEKYRPQAVNEKVQFEATENDEKVAQLLIRLLQAEISDSFSLPAAWWNDLKDGIRKIIGELGIARVIRQIRTSDNSDVNHRAIADWAYGAKDPNKKVIEILYRTKKTCLPTLDQATLLVLEKQWNRQNAGQEFKKSEWVKDLLKRKTLLELDAEIFKKAAQKCGFELPYQQEQISGRIAALRDNDLEANDFVPETIDLSFEPSIFPIWRKLLEIYAEKLGEEFPFEFTQSGMQLEDYCFAGPRKAGAPWFATLGEAKKVKACKRMVFGLEICADHPTKRLFALNQDSNEKKPPVIGIDIHLLPSAGMSPNYFGARQGGYIFNCDGWNKAHPNGGMKKKIYFDGPRPVIEGEEITVSPVYPHSAVGKRTSDSMQVLACLTPQVFQTLNEELSKVIFGYGAGELHFYELQELPKG